MYFYTLHKTTKRSLFGFLSAVCVICVGSYDKEIENTIDTRVKDVPTYSIHFQINFISNKSLHFDINIVFVYTCVTLYFFHTILGFRQQTCSLMLLSVQDVSVYLSVHVYLYYISLPVWKFSLFAFLFLCECYR
jgi:hypothetical protein